MRSILRLWNLMVRIGRVATTRPLHRSKRLGRLLKEYVAFQGGWRHATFKGIPQAYRLLKAEGPRRVLHRIVRLDVAKQVVKLEDELKAEALLRTQAERLNHKPLISLVVPVYRIKPRYLEDCIRSVAEQYYPNWELILVDDCSKKRRLTRLMQDWADRDARIRCIPLKQNVNISACTNVGIESARGDYIGFLDHDDVLTKDALVRVVERLTERPDADVVYSDSDKMDRFGNCFEPFYKPSWSPAYFRSVMYVGHLLVVRSQLLREVGGCDGRFDGVQDFELMLRLSEVTDRIEHVPHILYHWRVIPGSLAREATAKPRINELQQKAVQQHLDRLNIPGKAIGSENGHRIQVLPKPRSKAPLVSVMIPTRDRPELIGPCLDSLFKNTDYPNFEVLVGDNETEDPEAIAIFDKYPIRRVELPGKFHFAAFNNTLAKAARGEYLLLLNNDTEILQSDWLDQLMLHAEQPGVGAVGPMLVYDDGTIQHAGVILGPRGTADHLMRFFPADTDGYVGSLPSVREVSAVTGACLLVDREKYEACGGLNEKFRRHYEDLDFCLDLSERGFVNLYVGSVRLMHHESKTRGSYYDFTDRILLLDRWEHRIDRGDPYYNPNFDAQHVDYSLRVA